MLCCISLHSLLSICPVNRCSPSSRPLTPSPPRGQTEDTCRCSPEGRCDWWSSGQVGSASVSLHNNILVLSPEHMGPAAPGDKGGSCLKTFDSWFWAPFLRWSHTHTHTRPAEGQMGLLASHTLMEDIMWLLEDFLCQMNQRNSFQSIFLFANLKSDTMQNKKMSVLISHISWKSQPYLKNAYIRTTGRILFSPLPNYTCEYCCYCTCLPPVHLFYVNLFSFFQVRYF